MSNSKLDYEPHLGWLDGDFYFWKYVTQRHFYFMYIF